MNGSEITHALNADLADTLGSIAQYMSHCHGAAELKCAAESETFEQVAREEMQHAERLAERVVQLGEEPVTTASWHQEKGSLKQMLKDDLAREKEAIRRYRLHIRLCIDFVDPVTRLMLEEILTDEEKHIHLCRDMLCGEPTEKAILKKWQDQVFSSLQESDRTWRM